MTYFANNRYPITRRMGSSLPLFGICSEEGENIPNSCFNTTVFPYATIHDLGLAGGGHD